MTAKAEGLVLSGNRTGEETDLKHVKSLYDKGHQNLWIGSGLRPDNLEAFLPWIQGGLVGTSLQNANKKLLPDVLKKMSQLIEQSRVK